MRIFKRIFKHIFKRILNTFLKQLQLETSYQMINILPFYQNNFLKEENKMYAQSPCTLINEFVHRLTKIPISLITQQEFFGK